MPFSSFCFTACKSFLRVNDSASLAWASGMNTDFSKGERNDFAPREKKNF